MVMPPLPTELVDAIVDEFADEKDMLQACAVLSRRWLLSSRRHIFKRCVFTGKSGGELLGLESPYHRKLKAFVEFLEREAYVGRYIKTFDLCCDFVDPEPEGQGKSSTGGKEHRSRSEDPVYHVDAGLLLQALEMMPLLTTLELWQICLERRTGLAVDGAEAPSLSRSLNLKRLGLHWIPSHTSDHVHIPYLFELLPNVDDVHMVDCTFGSNHLLCEDGTVSDEHLKMVFPPDTHMRVLDIKDSRTPPLLLSLLDTKMTKSIKELYIVISKDSRTLNDKYHIKRFIENAGPNLTDMELKFERGLDGTTVETFNHVCDDLVKPCVNLETFHFHLAFEQLGLIDTSWNHLVRILQDLTSEKMEVVQVDVYPPVNSGVPDVGFWQKHLPWDALREALSQEKLKSLRTVRIIEEYEKTRASGARTGVWKERELPEEIQELLKKEFEAIASKGVLKFNVVP